VRVSILGLKPVAQPSRKGIPSGLKVVKEKKNMKRGEVKKDVVPAG